MVAQLGADPNLHPYEGRDRAGGRAFKIWQRPRVSNSAGRIQSPASSPEVPHQLVVPAGVDPASLV
jgi:hypothetical protein